MTTETQSTTGHEKSKWLWEKVVLPLLGMVLSGVVGFFAGQIRTEHRVTKLESASVALKSETRKLVDLKKQLGFIDNVDARLQRLDLAVEEQRERVVAVKLAVSRLEPVATKLQSMSDTDVIAIDRLIHEIKSDNRLSLLGQLQLRDGVITSEVPLYVPEVRIVRRLATGENELVAFIGKSSNQGGEIDLYNSVGGEPEVVLCVNNDQTSIFVKKDKHSVDMTAYAPNSNGSVGHAKLETTEVTAKTFTPKEGGSVEPTATAEN